jgi:spore coat polysaccharide biosynthesis protein SpsF
MMDNKTERTNRRVRILAIVQARMSSSRLPGKVLADIGGEPMLVRVVERARRAKTVDEVVLATTVDPRDDTIEELCRERGYACYRGSVQDVLDRYYQAGLIFGADIIVRLTADCPIIDGEVIDETVNAFLGRSGDCTKPFPGRMEDIPYDFAANRLPPPWKRTYPIGLDTEVCAFPSLKLAWEEARQAHQREHVMPYLYEDFGRVEETASRFRVRLVDHAPDYGHLRWTVDTGEDLELVRQIYRRFENRDNFTWHDVLDLFEREPDLAKVNATVRHKNYQESEARS